MTAPMIFKMFLNSWAIIVLGSNFVTTINFSEPVDIAPIGISKKYIFYKKSKNRKNIFLKVLSPEVSKTNMTVITASGKIYNFLLMHGEKPHSTIIVKDGKKDHSFKKLLETKKYKVHESKNTYQFINKLNSKVLVNENIVSKRGVIYLPKGAPVFYQNKRILN